MKRRQLLKALPALCLSSAVRAQQGGRQDLDEQIKRQDEAREHDQELLPIYPRVKRAIANAPFSASFLATIPVKELEYTIRLWRRSDGSTRNENLIAEGLPMVEALVTEIDDYRILKSFTFLTVGGVPTGGVAESPIRREAFAFTEKGYTSRTSGDSSIERWQTVESEDSVLLKGVDDRPCKRLLLESPYGSKTLEVWISEDLQIILKEEFRKHGALQHLYVASDIDRSEPDPSLFQPPVFGSVAPGQGR